MSGIVQDIQRATPAVTTTGDYQSPNGAGTILEGITKGFMDVLGKNAGGSGSKTNWQGLYDYMSARRNEYNSKSMGESEARDFQDETYSTAYKKFGADASDVNNVASQVGFDLIQQRAKAQMERDKTIKAKDDQLTYNVGLEALGPQADLDSIMSRGAEGIATAEIGVEAMTRFGKLTPQQQQEALKKSSLPYFAEKAIQLGWKEHYTDERFNDIPEESAFMSYRNMQTHALVQKYNVTPTAAKAIVDRALLPYELTLYGDKVLEDHGLQYYREAADKAYKSDREIRSEDLLNQFMNESWEWNTPDGTTMVKGDVIIAQLNQDGSQGSSGAASRILSTLNATSLIPQMAKKLKSRYSYDHMRLLFSEDGATLAEILTDNPNAEKNVNDGRGQALKTAVEESNDMSDEERRTRKAYFLPQKQFNKSFKLTNGEDLSLEAFAALKNAETPEETEREVNTILTSIAQESNAATSKNGFYFLDKSGQLKYYGMVGQRLKNISGYSLAFLGLSNTSVQSAEALRDLTNSGRLMESGDVDAVIMRENIPEIKKTLEILNKYYGIPKEVLRENFNRAQIKNTDAGQRARSLQIFAENGEIPGAFFDESFTFTMTDKDADKVIEAIDSGNVAEAMGMDRSTAETIKDAARTGVGLVGSTIGYPLAVAAGAGIASITDEAREAQKSALLSGRQVPGINLEDVIDSTFGKMSVEDKLRILYDAVDDNEAYVSSSDGTYSLTFTSTAGGTSKIFTSLPQTEKQIDEAMLMKFDMLGNMEQAEKEEPNTTQVSKNSDGTFSIVSEDGSKKGVFKTAAEAFKAAGKIAVGAGKDVVGGVLDAAERTGRAPGEALQGIGESIEQGMQDGENLVKRGSAAYKLLQMILSGATKEMSKEALRKALFPSLKK